MRKRQLLLCGGVWLALAGGWCAAQQAKSETKTELPPELRITPDVSPLPALEVVTTRKLVGDPQRGLLLTTMKSYMLIAYGYANGSNWIPLQEPRLIGAPSWLGSQRWVINGKPSDEQRDAMKKMTPEQQVVDGQMQRRSVLEDLFKLKAHIETRQMPYFELVAAKGGLKIKEVPAVPTAPADTQTRPTSPSGGPPPGRLGFVINKDGRAMVNGHAVTMRTLISMLTGAPEVGGRQIVDKTGFTGSFDVAGMPWPGMIRVSPDLAGAAPAPAGDAETTSIFTTLEETLGLKLVPTKGPVEVVVIDSIEQPTEN